MHYDIVISGTIGSWDCLSAGYVRYLLDQKKDKDVHVAFCSLGGYVKEGLVMNQIFRDHGKVHAHAFGMNASISTIAMLGCKDIDIVKGSLFLIHNTSTVIFKYNQQNKEQLDEYIKEMTKQRNDLSTFDDVLAQMYADKTGKSKEECSAQMKKGNWLTAQEALDFGLVDSIREDKETEGETDRMVSNFVNLYSINNNYKEAGIPPLPKPQSEPSLASVVDSEGNPTANFLHKAVQGIKDLFLPNNADNKDKTMSDTKASFAALAAALGVDSITLDADGKLMLTKDQVKALNEKLPADGKPKDEKPEIEAPATNEPKDNLSEIKEELATLKNQIAQKDEQIKNLKGAPAPEDETDENPKDEQPALTAVAIYNSVKYI